MFANERIKRKLKQRKLPNSAELQNSTQLALMRRHRHHTHIAGSMINYQASVKLHTGISVFILKYSFSSICSRW